uniref:SH3 domain-containing GRB2-like protein n=1 Tax=Trichuris muris TaxID=70415 RepID=A0A5S6QLU1_TRIMR
MSDNFSKNIRKKTFRAKEMLLETLGKADRTVDESFEENASNFNKQQKNFDRLQHELLNYIQCLKAVTQASRGYYDAVRENYDNDWTGAEHVKAITHSLELLWDEYTEKLTEHSLNPLNVYCSQFVDLKAKIAKRGRKLVDYDGARHAYQSLKNNSKKPEDAKLLKAEQDLESAKLKYNGINTALSEELPILYDGRYAFLVNHLQTLFSAESSFHADSVKLLTEMQTVVTPKIHLKDSPANANSRAEETANAKVAESNNVGDDGQLNSSSAKANPPLSEVRANSNENNPFSSDTDESPRTSNTPPTQIQNGVVVASEDGDKAEQGASLYPDLSTLRVLYKVRATHRYTAEDTDELSFEAGEVILVVPYDDPDEQDDGWLMGVKEVTGQKGVFPANFTKPL